MKRHKIQHQIMSHAQVGRSTICYWGSACACCCFGHVWLCEMLWTVAHQAPLSMGFPRQEYWSGLPFPALGFIYYKVGPKVRVFHNILGNPNEFSGQPVYFQELTHAIHKMTWTSWEFHPSLAWHHFSQELTASHLVPLSYRTAVCKK